jgi:predicted aspartyl protease
VVEIPLEIIRVHDDGFHLLVEVVVFGQNFKAVVDTGASKTVFDKELVELFVDKSSLVLSEKLSTGLGTNSMESFTLQVPEIKLGDLVITDIEVAVLDLSMINLAYEKLEIGKIIGVIGGDIFMKHGAAIDYGNCRMTFSV